MTYQLPEFRCIYITLQWCDFRSIASFWEYIGKFYNVTSENEFLTLLKTSPKRVVIFFDEFDALLSAPEKIRRYILNFLRGLKETKSKFNLQAVVGIGPYDVLRVSTDQSLTLSPFADTMTVEYFSVDDVKALFDQFTQTTTIEVDPAVIKDIHTLTRGHPGLVQYCGRQLELFLPSGQKTISLSFWEQFSGNLITLIAEGYHNATRLATRVMRLNVQERELLEQALWSGSILSRPTNFALLQKLASEGFLLQFPTRLFYEIPSPLIRALILSLLQQKRNVPTKLFNSVPELFLEGLPFFDWKKILRTAHSSKKMNRAPGVSRELLVPSEYAYHTELYFLLRTWLPKLHSADSEVSYPGSIKKYLDLMVWSGTVPKLLLEIVSHSPMIGESKNTVEAHCKKTEDYFHNLGGKEAWVINFMIFPEKGVDFKELYYPPTTSPVKILHIFHDLDATKALLVWQEKGEIQSRECVLSRLGKAGKKINALIGDS